MAKLMDWVFTLHWIEILLLGLVTVHVIIGLLILGGKTIQRILDKVA